MYIISPNRFISHQPCNALTTTSFYYFLMILRLKLSLWQAFHCPLWQTNPTQKTWRFNAKKLSLYYIYINDWNYFWRNGFAKITCIVVVSVESHFVPGKAIVCRANPAARTGRGTGTIASTGTVKPGVSYPPRYLYPPLYIWRNTPKYFLCTEKITQHKRILFIGMYFRILPVPYCFR